MRWRGAWAAAKLLQALTKSSPCSLFPSAYFFLFFYMLPYLSFKPALMEKDLCICKWQSWNPITSIQWSSVERPTPGLDYWPLRLISAPSPGNYSPTTPPPPEIYTHTDTHTHCQTCSFVPSHHPWFNHFTSGKSIIFESLPLRVVYWICSYLCLLNVDSYMQSVL